MRSTEKVSLGRQCEQHAEKYCREKHYAILKKNWHLGFTEIDVLAVDAKGDWVAIEVRGRSRPGWNAWEAMSEKKKNILRKGADYLRRRFKKRVRVELVEVTGTRGNVATRSWRLDF